MIDYPTLSIVDIQQILLSVPSDDNHSLFMWAIDKFLIESEIMAKEIGYKLHARLIWDKMNGVAPAFTVRFSHEYLLWMYKGKFTPIIKEQRGKWTTVLRESATIHSRKPVIARKFIEDIYGDVPRIELFARERTEGWDVWGNEVTQAG
jgi:N6-adenosine-specific RNA methylase IME4